MASCWEALSPPAAPLSCWCLAARLFTNAQETLQHLRSILLFFIEPMLRSRSPFDRLQLQIPFTGSGSSSYKKKKKKIFWLASSENEFLPSQLFTSSGSAQKYRLLFRFRGTVRDQGMLFFLQVIGPHLEPVPGFANPVCSGLLRIYFYYIKTGLAIGYRSLSDATIQ